jgi:PAS domain S-box-containing protein
MIWGTGPDKLCNYCNQKWLDFRGRSMEQEAGEGWVEGVHPDDLDYCRQTCAAAFDAREPFQVEYRLRRFDGEYRTVLDVGKPVYGPDGAFHGYVGYCFDVTEMSRVGGKLSEEAKPA